MLAWGRGEELPHCFLSPILIVCVEKGLNCPEPSSSHQASGPGRASCDQYDQLSQALSALCWCHSWGLASDQPAGFPPSPAGSVGPPEVLLGRLPPRPADFRDHCPSLGETSVAKIVLWPLPGPCELVPTYTCLFFLLFFFWRRVRQTQKGGANMGNRCFWKRLQGNAEGRRYPEFGGLRGF